MAGQKTEQMGERKPNYDIDPLFLNRWSPRSMTAEEMDEEEFMPLFEAARWAPSSYNAQLWRFIYSKRNTPGWNTFLDLLVEANRVWAQKAALLVVVISRKNFEFNEKPSVTHVFDAGSAWENLALEASRRGLVAHGMEGFDYAKTRKALQIPDNYDVCAMFAIGKKGAREDLPPKLQEMEYPSGRRPLNEIVLEGKFKGK